MMDRRGPSSRWLWRVFVSVLVVVLVVPLMWWMRSSGQSGDPVGSPDGTGRHGGVCVGWYSPNTDEQCRRSAEDQARRHSVTDDHRVAADLIADDLDQVLMRLGRCMTPEGAPCGGVTAVRPVGEPDVPLLRQSLDEAGIPVETARLAHAGDPAPPGSLFYAVPLAGGGCVVGFVTSVPGGGGQRAVVGSLPDGRCSEA